MRSPHLAALLLALLLAADAYGQSRGAPPAHFQYAVRLGYAHPWAVFEDSDGGYGQRRSGQANVAAELGARFARRFFAGGFVGLGVGRSLDCEGSCPAYAVWLGGLALVSLAPGRRVDPWVGFGSGFTFDVFKAYYMGKHTSTASFDFAQFLLGCDIRVSRAVAIGPYLAGSLGSYVWVSSYDAAPITYGKLNEWLMAGVRVVVGR